MPRVRIHLNTPIAVDAQKPLKPLMFDGLLGYAWAVKNGYTKTPTEKQPKNLIFPELPLEKVGKNCYAASAAFMPPEAFMQPETIIRRADWQGAMARHGITMRNETSVGWQQACREAYWMIATPYVDFYYQGDSEKVKELLIIVFKLRHLGAKRAAGYGYIRKIELTENAEDWSIWRNGIPTRQIPVSIVGERKDLIKEWTTYYPPYWATANNTWCYMPDAKQWLPSIKADLLDKKLKDYYKEKTERIWKGEAS